MLIRLGEQEAATDLDIVVKMHACQRVENKSHKNSEVFLISELLVSLMVLNNRISKVKLLSLLSLTNDKDVLEFLKQPVPYIYQYMKL